MADLLVFGLPALPLGLSIARDSDVPARSRLLFTNLVSSDLQSFHAMGLSHFAYGEQRRDLSDPKAAFAICQGCYTPRKT